MDWWLYGAGLAGLLTLHAVHTTALSLVTYCLKPRGVLRWQLLLAAEEVLATFNALLSVFIGVRTVTTTFHDVIHARGRPISLGFTGSSSSLSVVDQWTSFLALYFMYDLWAMYRVHVARRFSAEDGVVGDRCGSGVVSNGCVGRWDGSSNGHPSQSPFPRSSSHSSCQQRIRSFVHAKLALVVHHVGITLFGVPVVLHYRGVRGDFMIGCFFLLEMSTPFVALRAVLAAFNKKCSRLYMVNGYCMMLVFFICRILIFPFMYWACSRTLRTTFLQVFFVVPYFCHIGNALILSIQIYWFSLMVCGAMRIMRTRATSHRLKST